MNNKIKPEDCLASRLLSGLVSLFTITKIILLFSVLLTSNVSNSEKCLVQQH